MSFECVLVFINLINPHSVDIARVLDNVELQASWFVILGMTSILFYSNYKLFLEPVSYTHLTLPTTPYV